MSKIVAIEQLTLDGVYQGPARPDEDIRDGFWPKQPPNPMTEALSKVEKFVVSTSLRCLPVRAGMIVIDRF